MGERFVGRLPFRAVVAIPFALLIVLAVALTGYLAFQNGQRAVTDLANELHKQAAARIHQHLNSYLGTPQLINQLNQDAISLGQLDVNDADATARHFLAQMQRFDSVIALTYADEHRGYVGSFRKVLGVDLGLAVASESTGYTLEAYRITPQGGRELVDSEPDYDPRTRPWYQAAVLAGQTTWTPVFVWTSGDLGLDAVMPVYAADNSLLGVLDTSLTLNGIGDYLQNLQVSKNGETFIVDRSGLLVASSIIREPYVRTGDAVRQLSVLEGGDPAARAAAQSLEQQFGALANIKDERLFSFYLAGERHLAQVTPYADGYGLDWLIVTVTPESDFIAQIEAGNRQTILLIAVALLASVILAAVLTRWITRPIIRLNQSARGLAQGDWMQRVEINRADEIGELSASFNHMADQLQAAFASVQASEEGYRRLFEESPVSLWEVDASALKSHLDRLRESGVVDWRGYFEAHPEAVRACAAMIQVTNVNRATVALFKTGDKAPLLAGLARFFVETSYAVFGQELIALAEGKSVFEAETVRQTLEGNELQVNLRSGIASGHEGTWSKMLVSLTDITERKQAEAGLRESEERFRSLSEAAFEGIMIHDQGLILDTNQVFADLFGYDRPEDLIGKNGLAVLSLTPNSKELLQTNIRSGSTAPLDIEVLRRDGSTFPAETQGRDITVKGRKLRVVTMRDITERKRAEEAVRESEERTRLILDTALDAVITMDGNSVITGWNPQAATIFGWSREAASGRFAYDLFMPPRYRDAHLQGMAHFLATGEGPMLNKRFEITAQHRDGHEFPVELEISPLKSAGAFTFSAFVRDITERKRAEAALVQNAAELAALYRATTPLVHPVGDLNRLAEEIARAVTQEFALADCGIMLVDEAQTELIRVARAGSYEVAAGPALMLDGPGLTVAAFRSGETVYAPEAQTDPRYIRSDSRTRSELVIPLRVSGRLIGMMDLQSPEPDAFDERARRIVAAYAERAALALQAARLHAQTEEQLRRLVGLRAVDTAITASLDIHFTLRILLEQVTMQLGVDAADVLILNAGIGELEYAAGRGFRSNIVERARLRLGQDYAGRVALERQPLSWPDMSAGDPGFARAGLWSAEGFRAYYAVPLVAKGAVKGVLEIFHRAPLKAQTNWLDFLESLARQAAIAIDNAELFTELQSSNLQLFLAYDATIEGWSRALDLRDKETEGHTVRVTEMTLTLARALRLTEDELVHIRRGALLHDIGKMGVPDGILLKAGQLTDEEWTQMRKHPVYAYEMLAPIAYLHPALDIPYCHHEKWDGTGYPRGLRGEQIPLAARIFAVADVWDALRSDRPYRPGWPEDKVRAQIEADSGKHFDPRVVEVFLSELQ